MAAEVPEATFDGSAPVPAAQPRARLTPRMKIGWSIAQIGIAFFIGININYMLFFLTQGHGIGAAAAGLALLVPRIWDIVVDPFIGALSDRTKSRWGRRLPYVLGGSVLAGASLATLFAMPAAATESAKLTYFFWSYLLVNTAMSVLAVPYVSMIPEMTQDYDERTELTGYRMLMARLGIVLAVFLGPLVFQGSSTLAEGFRNLGLLLGGIVTASGLATFFLTRDAPNNPVPIGPFRPLAEWRSVARNRPLTVLLAVFAVQNVAIGAGATTLIYYLLYVAHADPSWATVLAVSALIATPFWMWLMRRWERKTAYWAGLAIIVSTLATIAMLDAFPFWLVLGLFVVLGTGDACSQLAPNAMVLDTVEVTQQVTGERREGTINGVWSFTLMLGMTLGGYLASVGLGLFDVHALQRGSTPSAEQVRGIQLVYTLLPIALWLAAAALLALYRLDRVSHAELVARLNTPSGER